MSHRPGQTMLEMVIATGVIIVSVVSATTLIISTITAGRVSQNRIEAANLAREGIEIVRGIRDGNWLRFAANVTDQAGLIYTWDENPMCSNCPADDTEKKLASRIPPIDGRYKITYLEPSTMPQPSTGWEFEGWRIMPCPAGSCDETIYFNNALGLYTQENCEAPQCVPSRFSRVIEITAETEWDLPILPVWQMKTIDVSYLDVKSTVTWNDRTGAKHLTAEEFLYNWR